MTNTADTRSRYTCEASEKRFERNDHPDQRTLLNFRYIHTRKTHLIKNRNPTTFTFLHHPQPQPLTTDVASPPHLNHRRGTRQTSRPNREARTRGRTSRAGRTAGHARRGGTHNGRARWDASSGRGCCWVSISIVDGEVQVRTESASGEAGEATCWDGCWVLVVDA
jgi:hypothetical protein